MANIQVSDLRPAGTDLFLDSESYLSDLTEGEMMNTLGGRDVSASICIRLGKFRMTISYCKFDERRENRR